jgi:hypothetical protein
MSSIRELCTEIVRAQSKLGMPVAENLLPGLSERRILSLTKNLPFALPRSAVELYKWSAGMDPNAGIGDDFLPGYGMDSLTEMVAMYRGLSADSDYPRFAVGKRRWFPLLRSGGTDFYGICCERTPTADGEIVYDDNEGPHRDCITPPPVAYLSLETMLRTTLCCFETGVYYLNEDGQLDVGIASYYTSGPRQGQLKDVDVTAYKQVGRQFNPGLVYWE